MTATSNVLFMVRVAVLIPTLLLGGTLAALTIATLLVFRRKLLISQLDYTLLLLLSTVLVWATSTALRFSLDAFDPAAVVPAYERIDAAISYFCFLWLIVSNVLLALSRYFVFRETPESSIRRYSSSIVCVGILLSMIIAAVCSVLTATPNRFGLEYLEAGVSERAVVAMSLVILGTLTFIAWIYLQTYLRISRNLSTAWTSNLDMRIRLLLQKKALKTCAAMSSCTLISYLPIGIALPVSLTLPDGLRSLPTWVIILMSECALLDTVLTPIAVLVFMPRVRSYMRRMLWVNRDEEMSTEADTNDEDDFREGIELTTVT
ncbi:hypothetical protein HDU83_009348 [Entophlyctis luteolus]|nr:hypothetical protein HDU83_009348 [Entophlyctis luteolus]KAJ3388971.1 hypothetical protein HDU84_009295 [Entophlyctis sp. JEL0112]